MRLLSMKVVMVMLLSIKIGMNTIRVWHVSILMTILSVVTQVISWSWICGRFCRLLRWRSTVWSSCCWRIHVNVVIIVKWRWRWPCIRTRLWSVCNSNIPLFVVLIWYNWSRIGCYSRRTWSLRITIDIRVRTVRYASFASLSTLNQIFEPIVGQLMSVCRIFSWVSIRVWFVMSIERCCVCFTASIVVKFGKVRCSILSTQRIGSILQNRRRLLTEVE